MCVCVRLAATIFWYCYLFVRQTYRTCCQPKQFAINTARMQNWYMGKSLRARQRRKKKCSYMLATRKKHTWTLVCTFFRHREEEILHVHIFNAVSVFFYFVRCLSWHCCEFTCIELLLFMRVKNINNWIESWTSRTIHSFTIISLAKIVLIKHCLISLNNHSISRLFWSVDFYRRKRVIESYNWTLNVFLVTHCFIRTTFCFIQIFIAFCSLGPDGK